MNATTTTDRMNASAINAAAADHATGFTPKAFIADVFAAFSTQMTRSEFDSLLVDLLRKGLIELSRCDLVGAFDETKVRASILDVGGPVFHFVRVA